jgi:hypothetical protein
MQIGIATFSLRCGCMCLSLSVGRLRSWICSLSNWEEQRRRQGAETLVPGSPWASGDAKSDGVPACSDDIDLVIRIKHLRMRTKKSTSPGPGAVGAQQSKLHAYQDAIDLLRRTQPLPSGFFAFA